MFVSEAISEYLSYQQHKLSMGIIREATLTAANEYANEVKAGLPDVEVEQLQPSSFQKLLQHAATHWGAVRLKHLRHFVKGWLKWLEELGHIERVPRTGRMETPQYRPTPKALYTPAELRELWESGKPLTRCLLGLGLFAGMNCADAATLTHEWLDGQWLTQPRHKTGVPRRAYLPSHVVRELQQLGLPLRSIKGEMNRRRISCYWRDTTRRLWGSPRPFTALRTTLRTVTGHVDAEALELCVMGHTPASAAMELGRSRVGLEHYVRADAISDARLRAITKAITSWLKS